MASKIRRYWDSDCFIGWLAEEPEKVDACRRVIDAAERGELTIVTSSLTLAEVVKVKSQTPLDQALREKVRLFFMNDYLIVRQLDRFLAERARDLWWDFGVEPKDGVHVATALAAGLTQFDTFDAKLIARSGLIGSPPLMIGKPDFEVREQLAMSDIGFEDVVSSLEQLDLPIEGEQEHGASSEAPESGSPE